MRPTRTTAVAVLVLVSACASVPDWPITRTGQPLSELNERLRGATPPLPPVTYERLLDARGEPWNWLTYYGAYDGWRYSPLDQIHTGNVARLKPAWIFQHGIVGLLAAPAFYAFEAAPIVVDGVMYVTGPDGWIWALDAATGEMFWMYHYATPLDTPLCCGNVNRGAAVADGKVFYTTANAHLLALDARTGELLWDQVFADIRAGETATAAPLIVKDLVIVGSAGAEYGVRGHLDAFDRETGELRWRRYNVPAPGEPGSETWPGTGVWAVGGGSTWLTGTYDPELDLLYWGTGNPGPDFNGEVRPGDNLFTSSVLALDPDTGERVWHYQYTPHDVWDYDAVNENILFELDGRKVLAHFDKNGHLFVLDRTTGELLRVTPFARTTWGRIDPETGGVYDRRDPTPQGTEVCPGPAGGKEWNHASYSPRTGLLYAPIIELCAVFKQDEPDFALGMPFWGGVIDPIAQHDKWGEVAAFDPRTGEKVWSWRHEFPVVASTLTTAGDLLFTGLATGEAVAFDARTGELLWSFQTGSGIHSNPVTYMVDGRQYVAIPSGWGGWVKGFAPQLAGAPRGSAIVVFALP